MNPALAAAAIAAVATYRATRPRPPLPSHPPRSASPRWRVVRVAGDGNCLFRALAHARGECHAAVRARVAARLAARWEDYEPFVPKGERADYLAAIGQSGTWGDELVLRAFAEDACVEVRAAADPARVLARHGAGPVTHVVVFSGDHYDALEPADSRSLG